MLYNPKSGETIGVYLDHTDKVVSLVLFIDQRGRLVYFLNKKLAGAKLMYPVLYKVTLALIHSAKRLYYYFQGRVVKVYTEYPLRRSFRHVKNQVTRQNRVAFSMFSTLSLSLSDLRKDIISHHCSATSHWRIYQVPMRAC